MHIDRSSTQTTIRRPALIMRWAYLAFLHWRADARSIQHRLPPGLQVDTFDGSAWIGLVPFTMPVFRPPIWPAGLNMWNVSAFHECNVRTYVRPRGGGEPGVWFFSLDATSRINVWGARRFMYLPYRLARIHLAVHGSVVDYRLRRSEPGANGQVQLHARWRVGRTLPPSRDPADPARFLTERYLLYASDGLARLWSARIDHQPWPLRRAELIHFEDELITAANLVVDRSQPPIAYASDPIDVRASRLERVHPSTPPHHSQDVSPQPAVPVRRGGASS